MPSISSSRTRGYRCTNNLCVLGQLMREGKKAKHELSSQQRPQIKIESLEPGGYHYGQH
ncbi:hypothetical protein C8R44DRAFT_815154 [Mycena epipterygia]|nr:hypothetical protein C8R44DRAFT_815154 [Mycena epipterygia]